MKRFVNVSTALLCCASWAFVGCSQILGIEGLPDLPASADGSTRPPDAVDAGAVDAGAVDARAADARAADAADAQVVGLCDPDDAALVGCFEFEDMVQDASGSGLSVTAENVGFVDGVRGRAMAGTAQSIVRLGESAALDVAAFTIEMWVRPGQLPQGTSRAMTFDNDGQYAMFVLADATVRCVGNNSTNVEQAGLLTVGVWTHLACVHDGSLLRLYVNGQASNVASASPPVTTATNGSNIGGDSPSGGDRFIGAIDDLRVWNRARTPAEICAAAGCTD
jgi:hypothetical protein